MRQHHTADYLLGTPLLADFRRMYPDIQVELVQDGAVAVPPGDRAGPHRGPENRSACRARGPVQVKIRTAPKSPRGRRRPGLTGPARPSTLPLPHGYRPRLPRRFREQGRGARVVVRALELAVLAQVHLHAAGAGAVLSIALVFLDLISVLLASYLAHMFLEKAPSGFDRSLEEAAQDLGATPWRTFRLVTLPLVMPGVLGGALMAFTLSFDEFVLTFFVAGGGVQTLPLVIYNRIRYLLSPEINAISTVALVLTAVVIWATAAILGAFGWWGAAAVAAVWGTVIVAALGYRRRPGRDPAGPDRLPPTW